MPCFPFLFLQQTGYKLRLTGVFNKLLLKVLDVKISNIIPLVITIPWWCRRHSQHRWPGWSHWCWSPPPRRPPPAPTSGRGPSPSPRSPPRRWCRLHPCIVGYIYYHHLDDLVIRRTLCYIVITYRKRWRSTLVYPRICWSWWIT